MKSEIYKSFMKNYEINHEVCPKCGAKEHNTTLVGYIFMTSNPEAYKDLNNCTCKNCGDKHTKHERISLKEFNKKNKK